MRFPRVSIRNGVTVSIAAAALIALGITGARIAKDDSVVESVTPVEAREPGESEGFSRYEKDWNLIRHGYAQQPASTYVAACERDLRRYGDLTSVQRDMLETRPKFHAAPGAGVRE